MVARHQGLWARHCISGSLLPSRYSPEGALGRISVLVLHDPSGQGIPERSGICLEESLFTDRSIVSVSTLQELFFGYVSLGFRRVPGNTRE